MNLLKIITPLNIREEKEKFFASRQYVPIFKYEWDNGIIITEKNRLKYSLIKAIINQDNQSITNLASEYFGVTITSSMLDIAGKIIERNKSINLEVPKIEDVKIQFEKAFHFFNLPYKASIVDQQGFNFRPNNKDKELVISKYANFENFSVDGEILHEMTHIIRYENGKYNKLKRGRCYLQTEEGLASFIQDYKGERGTNSIFQHASEFAVTNICMDGSLREAIDYLESIGFSKELAWQRAIRHKFGFKDTSTKGDIMKPAMYFFYEQKIKDLSRDKLLSLFSGKVSLNYEFEYKGKFGRNEIIEFFRL